MSGYPIKWVSISDDEREEKLRVFKEAYSKEVDQMISIPQGVQMPSKFVKEKWAEKIYNFNLRQDDIWIVTFPKCGTTWTQEIVWQIVNDIDVETAQHKDGEERVPFLEIGGLRPTKNAYRNLRPYNEDPITFADNLPTERRRVIKSHLTFEMLPPKLLDTCKVVYVCRNPKDTFVSFYKMHEMITPEMGDAPFEDFANLAREGKILYGSYWEHLKSGWSRKGHPNMKFIWFEDLKEDIAGNIKDIGHFLGYNLTREQVDMLCKITSIDNMRSVSKNLGRDEKEKEFAEKFFRKGKVGGWADYFHGEKLEEFNKWMDENMEGTDITLPKNTITL